MPVIKSIFSLIRKIFAFAFKTRRRAIISLIIIIVLGYFGYRQFFAKKGVKTATVSRETFEETVSASGKVKAYDMATLNFFSTGKLAWVGVKEGDSVRKWQGLMGLDTTELNAAATAAWYNYLAADANAKEVEDTVKDHDNDETFTQKNLRVSAQTARDKAWDAWRVAQKALKDATLVTPISGVVVNLTANLPGDTVTLTDGITIVNPDSIYFQAEVDEIDYSKVREGQEVKLKLDAFPDKVFKGKVTKIAHQGVETSGGGINILVDIEFDPQGEKVIPSLNGEADFLISKKENALVIPKEYVIYKEGKTFVDVKEGRRVKEVEIELGFSSTDNAEVTKGLEEGQSILLQE